jgi:hypothetical protein
MQYGRVRVDSTRYKRRADGTDFCSYGVARMATDTLTLDRRDPNRPDRRKWPRGGRRAEDNTTGAATTFPDVEATLLTPITDATDDSVRGPNQPGR